MPIETMEYLHAHGCPWDLRACDAAAWVGDYAYMQYDYINEEEDYEERWNALKWLRARNPPAPWSAEAKAAAVEHFGEEEVRSWSA